ncbi:MAG: hypothetical protein ACE366_21270 [Bradymonadia bacterium]
MQNAYSFKKGVTKWATALGIMLLILVITIPVGIFFLVKRSGRLEIDAKGMTIRGFGLTASRWDFNDLARIGLLEIQVDAPFGQAINGGHVARNLCAVTKGGKKLKFMVSRFEETDAIIAAVISNTELSLERLSMGMNGAKWP